jgi:hypothetical protein
MRWGAHAWVCMLAAIAHNIGISDMLGVRHLLGI